MKASELREKTPSQLQDELENLLKDRFKLRMQSATGQLQTTHELKKARRTIARVKTILNEKQGN